MVEIHILYYGMIFCLESESLTLISVCVCFIRKRDSSVLNIDHEKIDSHRRGDKK